MLPRPLLRCVGTSDVMKAWDRTGDGQLNEKEFLHELASFFAGHEDLWEAEVKAVAAIAFRKVGYQRGESPTTARGRSRAHSARPRPLLPHSVHPRVRTCCTCTCIC